MSNSLSVTLMPVQSTLNFPHSSAELHLHDLLAYADVSAQINAFISQQDLDFSVRLHANYGKTISPGSTSQSELSDSSKLRIEHSYRDARALHRLLIVENRS